MEPLIATHNQSKPGALAPGLSLYLELLRLLAATEVVLFHLNGFPLLGGHRAAWNAFGHEAVVVFFVLSASLSPLLLTPVSIPPRPMP